MRDPDTNAVCRLLNCSLPYVLAGMGGVSRHELVAAVGEAGGFGFLGMVREPEALIWREVENLRERGQSNFGINIIPAATERPLLERQIASIIELHVPVVALFWDIDADVVARLRDAGIIVVHQIGSVDEAIAAERAGAEAIIAQGIEAGGHVRGTRRLAQLLPEVAAAVRVPVLAAGGLSTGGDLLVAQSLGADGIVLGTAMLATEESFAHDYHKRRLVAAGVAETSLTDAFHINWPPGAPVRVLSPSLPLEDPKQRIVIGEEEGRPIYLFSTDSPLRSMTGDFARMALYAGAGVGRIAGIVSAAERLRTITAGAERLMADTSGEELAEFSSAVCYVSESTDAYAGNLDSGEIAAELRALGGELLQLLQASLADGDPNAAPFTDSSYTYAAWVAALEQMVGSGWRATPGIVTGITAATILQRLGAVLPRLPEGGTRQRLLRLRSQIEADNVFSAVPVLSSISGQAASGR
jgi:nitronate monooxygenase